MRTALDIAMIWKHLDPYPYSIRMAVSWREVCDLYGPQEEWGEVVTEADLLRLPVDMPVRVVALYDGGRIVLRWVVDGSHEAARALGGYNHDHLERGDGRGAARSGYVTRHGDATVDVR